MPFPILVIVSNNGMWKYPLIALALGSLMPFSAHAASFNCNTADRPDDVLICQSRELSDLDERMSSLYFTLRNRLGGGERRELEADQSSWLRGRKACGRDFRCIERAYTRRIQQILAATNAAEEQKELNAEAAETGGFIFSGDIVFAAHDNRQFIRLSERLPIAQLKKRFSIVYH
jgi:uncharacterized protein